MRKPVARPTASTPKPQQAQSRVGSTSGKKNSARSPKAFAPDAATPDPVEFSALPPEDALPEVRGVPIAKKPNWALRFALGAGGFLISLGLGLMAERLVRDLFARYDWLGWLATGALTLFVGALVLLALREILALHRLNNLGRLRQRAKETLANNLPDAGRAIVLELHALYEHRPDLARAREQLSRENADQFDGAGMIEIAERRLMGPLDARARAMTAASARRVAIVTAISPRAIVDVAFVAYESMKLARAIATLYGARPGLVGGWKLATTVLAHLAVTGGVALGDSVIQQLLGHGLAAKLSARLGEGLVNGLMTVRVGIAAMGVTRPLPFDQIKQPMVIDFAPDLAKISQGDPA